jgi:plastocyanin
MHTLATQLAPILAAEKSKVPFYVAGGLLVAWALFVSLALGMRRPRFPGNETGQRGVIAISAVLVLAVVVTAVTTSGGSTAGAESHSAAAPATSSSTESAPPPASSAPAQSSSAAQPPAKSGGAPAPAAAAKPESKTSLKLAADPGGLLSFDTKQLSATSGAVSIAFTNASQLEHNVAVAQGTTVLGTTPTFAGGSKTLLLNLKAGTYTFYCSVPGHRQAGMEGTLKVS